MVGARGPQREKGEPEDLRPAPCGWEQRARSWSPHKLTDADTEFCGEEDQDFDSDDATVLLDGCRPVQIVGEAGAVHHLLSLPLRGAGDSELVCARRQGGCLVVLGRGCHEGEGSRDPGALPGGQAPRGARRARRAGQLGELCQVRVEGDMVRIYPRTEGAEPVDVGGVAAPLPPPAACCEWSVTEGLSLLAVSPRAPLGCGPRPGRSRSLTDLAGPPRTALGEPWGGPGGAAAWRASSGSPLSAAAPRHGAADQGHRTVALLVRLWSEALEPPALAEAWLSCCLAGTDTLLCFFVDDEGICRGCRAVAVDEIPLLADAAEAYRPGRRCLEAAAAAARRGEEDDGCSGGALPAVPLPAAHSQPPRVAQPGGGVRRALASQALLTYHAAVRLAAGPRPPAGAALCTVKEVPVGSRWTAKSCMQPLRVRQMMLRAVRALHVAGGAAAGPTAGAVESQFHLLLASANEFLADTFLAEEYPGNDSLDIARYLACLKHLRRSARCLSDYLAGPAARAGPEDFAQSIRRLEERVRAKRTNAHLSIVRLRQRQPWREGDQSLRALGAAVQELDEAEASVARRRTPEGPPRERPLGAHERSVLASISKWKADLLHELASLAMPGVLPGAELEPRLREYLEAQQRATQGELQAADGAALPAQCERWLQSAISLSLRGLHQLAALPSEVSEDLQLQARARLAQAYGDLGHVYASTGRYTKAMTHAKQGIELFNATKDARSAAQLQIWLCQLQLRMAVPEAAPAPGRPGAAAGGLEDAALLRGLTAAGPAEDGACAQVAAALERVLKELESGEPDEQALRREADVLLGRVLLRRGLTRLARSKTLRAVCHIYQEEAAVASALELLGAEEPADTAAEREAVEFLMQAAACFRGARDERLGGVAHACLAAVYCCHRGARAQRLALAHCERALRQRAAPAGGGAASAERPPRHAAGEGGEAAPGPQQVRIALRLLEARALRRAAPPRGGGASARASDARAAAALCRVALECQQLARGGGHAGECAAPAGQPAVGPVGAAPDRPGSGEDQDLVRNAVLAVDEKVLPAIVYVRQELNDVLLRLLKGNERQLGPGRELKALYCSLLTAWHSEAGLQQALSAVHDHVIAVAAAA